MSFPPPPADSPPPRQPTNLFPTRSVSTTVDLSPATKTALKDVAADAMRARAERDAIYQRIAGDATRVHRSATTCGASSKNSSAQLSDESVAARAELFDKVAADAQRRDLNAKLDAVIANAAVIQGTRGGCCLRSEVPRLPYSCG